MRSINSGASFFMLPTLQPSDGGASSDGRHEGAFAPLLLLVTHLLNTATSDMRPICEAVTKSIDRLGEELTGDPEYFWRKMATGN